MVNREMHRTTLNLDDEMIEQMYRIAEYHQIKHHGVGRKSILRNGLALKEVIIFCVECAYEELPSSES